MFYDVSVSHYNFTLVSPLATTTTSNRNTTLTNSSFTGNLLCTIEQGHVVNFEHFTIL